MDIKVLLVFLLASPVVVRCGEDEDGKEMLVKPTGVLASVREFPLFLHKCSATFVTKSTLICPAACLLCAGSCKMFVAVIDKHLEDAKVTVYDVKSTKIHPQYETNPSDYNIGIIHLTKNVLDAPVYDLPDYGMSIGGLSGQVYSWHFSEDMKDFSLVTLDAYTVTNELCSTYMSEFISNKYVCVKGEKAITLGPFDHGSPLICENHGRGVIIGTFVKPGVVEDDDIVLYHSIFPHLNWIKNHMTMLLEISMTTKGPYYHHTHPVTTKKPPNAVAARPIHNSEDEDQEDKYNSRHG